jgi:molybdopterin molybdotransferase
VVCEQDIQEDGKDTGINANAGSKMELTTVQQLIWSWASPKGTEWVPLRDGLGRVLAEPLAAPGNLPGEARSRLDGFALRSADSLGASEARALSLNIVPGMGAAGHWTDYSLQLGECLRILTGAPLPANADAVVASEDVLERDGRLVLTRPVPSGRSITAAGDEVIQGEGVLPGRIVLTPTRLALAAALGCAGLPVYRRPRVALLATGDEVLELGGRSTGPWSYCNNRHLLAWLVELQGGEAVHLGVAQDDPRVIVDCLAEADADLVITTGGIGQGERDFVLQAWQTLGVTVHSRQINLSPGKNSACGALGGRVYAALPGNPWAAQVVFNELLAPLLRRWQGLSLREPLAVPATTSAPIENRADSFKAVRGQLEFHLERLSFTPASGPGGMRFAQLQRSMAYALLPPNAGVLPARASVAVRCHDLPLLAWPAFACAATRSTSPENP